MLLHLLIFYVPPPPLCQLVDPLATALHPANAPCRAVLLHLLILYVPPLAAMFSVVALRWDLLWRLVVVQTAHGAAAVPLPAYSKLVAHSLTVALLVPALPALLFCSWAEWRMVLLLWWIDNPFCLLLCQS